ncbi:MAG: aminotransferase class I/II-fold pyridoxal phosphate-dependent enzyme [Phycisphaeraceae bacterium]
MPYERDNISRLTPYTPGEQPQRGRVVKLNTNENPYPPAQAVLDAIAGVSGEMLRRYPPPSATGFRETAARVHGLTPQQVIATNGGDELLRMAVTVFCEPSVSRDGDEARGGIAMGEPSYSLYPVLAAIHDTPVTRVPLDDDYGVPEDFADKVIDADCRLALLVNPHAPSGRRESIDKLARIAAQLRQGRCVLLIDEAYVDFADGDALPLLQSGGGRSLDNVLLLRTLSKGYSLAGLRFGYGLGHADLIATLHKVRDSYNVDILAQSAATAALEHRDAAKLTWRKVIAQRHRLTDALRQRGYVVPDSQSNFLLATPESPPAPAGGSSSPPAPAPGSAAPAARSIYESLKAQGIFVRYFDQDRLRDKLRITIGTPQQNDELLTALDAMASSPKSEIRNPQSEIRS